MKKIYALLLIFPLIFGVFFYANVVRADNLDQQQNTGAISAGFGDTGNGRDYRCQGFKMATYNQVTAVSFYLNGKDGSGDIGYKIWIDNADSSSNPTGSVGVGIGGETEITNASLVTGALTKYTLSSTVNVTIGNQYTVCSAPWNTTTHAWTSSYQDWTMSVSNPYANGRTVILDGSFANPTAPDSGNMDWQFEIYGQTATVAVSSPTVQINGPVILRGQMSI